LHLNGRRENPDDSDGGSNDDRESSSGILSEGDRNGSVSKGFCSFDDFHIVIILACYFSSEGIV
jgi:hypothetical protein